MSSQYLGARAPEPVKKKVLEMVYSWTVNLPDETKISDAYQMLKKQGEPLWSLRRRVTCKIMHAQMQMQKTPAVFIVCLFIHLTVYTTSHDLVVYAIGRVVINIVFVWYDVTSLF